MFTRRRFVYLLSCIPVLGTAQKKIFFKSYKREVNVNVVSEISSIHLFDGLLVRTRGYYNIEDGCGALYLINRLSSIIDNKYIIKINETYGMTLITSSDCTPLKQLGVHFDGMHDDTYLLRAIFRFPGCYYMDKGRIIVSDYIELSSDITLFGAGPFKTVIEYLGENGNWLFINGKKGDSNFLQGHGYNGRGNYHFRDFTIDLRGDIASHSRSAMIFGRSANVYIRNIIFMNGKNSHRIECNSQSNFNINNCFFINTVTTDTFSHEEINIDFNSPKGFPAFGEWDNTACENIIISSCCFINVQAGLGSHSYNMNKHKNIRVENCIFNKIKKIAIRFQSVDNSIIEGCVFEHVDGVDIALLDASNNVINKNLFSKKENILNSPVNSQLNFFKNNKCN